ncbi:MAG TPA: RHS repeat-associated core domain-containing protein [Solirubrobacter sp.]|nr:RHS repeat-associated core domain-containing protein [Solirubrobacter sp.]
MPEPAPLPHDGLPSSFDDSVSFLYEGPDKIQTGVVPGTIKPARVAVLRGSVHTRSGAGLGNVAVTVLDHPELGRTLTRADGSYDIAVNGGGTVTLKFERDGNVAAQREVTVPWQDFAAVDDLVMVAYDTAVTRIDPSSGGVATANPVTDADGTRTASVEIPAGTKAEMVLPDGTKKPLDKLDIRATEFTAGASGPEAMPGELPAGSAYTYAAELSVDQAVAAGATEVRFDRPVINYVDNFLHFPVGGIVPTGYYDRVAGEWKADRNGRIVKIVSIVDGKAQVDTDGDGQADGGLGIDDAERTRLAATRHVQDELWRVPIEHFSPHDHNWPFAPDPDAVPPTPPEPRVDVPTNRKPGECNKAGSIIGCQGQTLGEELPVTGTPFGLRYDSRRAGRKTDRSIDIPLTGHSIPDSLEAVHLEVIVAGRKETKVFAPKKDLVYEYAWDRHDAYGREVQGRQPIEIRIGFQYGLRRYDTPYEVDRAFAKFSRNPETIIGAARTESEKYISWRVVRDEFGLALGGVDARGTGLGGWELTVHHAYDARMRTLYRGDGLQVGAEPVLDTLADTLRAGDPRDADVAADGSVWVANAATDQVIRFDKEGKPEVMAGYVGGGGGCENCRSLADDGPLAKGFTFSRPVAVALTPDGGFYVADFLIDWGVSQSVIYRVGPDGRIHKIAGCMCSELGDGGSALDASMNALDLAVGPDGTLYLADYRNARIRAIDADGTIRTVAGGGPENDAAFADGVLGTRTAVWEPMGLEVGADGSVYFADDARFARVRRLAPDGSVTTVAGGHPFDASDNGDGGLATAANLNNPQGLSLGADGSLYLTDFDRIRRVGVDGRITTVAGGGGFSAKDADKVPPGSVRFEGAMGVDAAPDGSLYIASRNGLSRVSRPFPVTEDGLLAVPSKDGGEVYFFDAGGRHVRTQDGLSGTVLWRFGYDDAGRLASVTDADGQVTRIERDGDGAPTAIVAPGGQRTALSVDARGRLDGITDPAGERTGLGYDGKDRLASLVDRRGGHHSFLYDDEGRLIRDEDPTGKAQTLSRTDSATGYVVTLTSPEGRKTSWEVGVRPTGEAFLETTSPSGARTVSSIGIDGIHRQTLATGETIELTQTADPRWGFYVPIMKQLVRRSPLGRTTTTTAVRSVELADENDPLSVVSLTDTFTTNGRALVTRYDAADRTQTIKTPEGRTTTKTYDVAGHVVELDPGSGMAPISYEYDARGMLRRSAQADRSLRWEPDARGRPAVQIDAQGRRTEFTYDDADRIVAVKRPGGGVERYEYDAEGARTAVISPSGERHELSRDDRGLLAGFAGIARGHNADRQLTSEGAITYGFEATGGRATGASFAGTEILYGYAGELDRPETLTRTSGGMTEGDKLSYDGAKLTGLDVTGSAAGAFTFGYDDDGFLKSTKLVSGAQTLNTALARDKDGLLTGDGPFVIAREGVGGAASAITGAGLTAAIEQDATGQLKSRTLSAGGQQRYRLELVRDSRGRITRKTETIDGAAHAYDYRYDADGQLLEVARDASVIEQYTYDANGNRTTRRLGDGAVETSTFEDDDRMAARGTTAYAYDDAGFLKSRGADTFEYSPRGELLSATVGVTTVGYRYDALGRRVARVQGSEVTQYLYGDPGNSMRVTATRSPAGVLTSYRYDDDGFVYAFERGGARFFVGTDQVGSPRVVTNASGVVQDVREYDAYGNLVSESAPTFDLPIGYAGGLDDRVTGLVRFGFRDLDTASGRWTARDPALYDGGQVNLYGYVGGDPVSHHDPLGLWCVGGSYYEGVGGGATVCHTDEGWAVCVEAGLGFGWAVGLDNQNKLPEDGGTVFAEAKANIKGFGVGISAEMNDCGQVTSTGSIDAAFVNVNIEDGTLQLENPVMEEGWSVKAGLKVCKRL